MTNSGPVEWNQIVVENCDLLTNPTKKVTIYFSIYNLCLLLTFLYSGLFMDGEKMVRKQGITNHKPHFDHFASKERNRKEEDKRERPLSCCGRIAFSHYTTRRACSHFFCIQILRGFCNLHQLLGLSFSKEFFFTSDIPFTLHFARISVAGGIIRAGVLIFISSSLSSWRRRNSTTRCTLRATWKLHRVSTLEIVVSNCCRSRISSYFCNITRNCFTVCPSSAT